MISTDQIEGLQAATAYDQNGDKLGGVGQVYLDDSTGEPSWMTVKTGLFGRGESFVPLQGARFDGGDRVDLACSQEQVKGAPRVDPDAHLDPRQERDLYRHYNLRDGDGDGDDGEDRGDDRDSEDGAGHGHHDAVTTAGRDATASGRDATASGRDASSGRARLVRYVVTEQQQITVPVSREEVRIETDGADEGQHRAGADSGHSASDDDDDEGARS